MTDRGLRIPKTELTVLLALQGGEKKSVGLQLVGEKQHLIDLLESEESFLPVHEGGVGEGGSWSILNKRAVLWASIALVDGRLPIEEAADAPLLYDTRADVRVEFLEMDALTGEMLYSPPAARARVTDHLNRRDHFFRLWTADFLYIVNKHHVLRVVESQTANEDQ